MEFSLASLPYMTHIAHSFTDALVALKIYAFHRNSKLWCKTFLAAKSRLDFKSARRSKE